MKEIPKVLNTFDEFERIDNKVCVCGFWLCAVTSSSSSLYCTSVYMFSTMEKRRRKKEKAATMYCPELKQQLLKLCLEAKPGVLCVCIESEGVLYTTALKLLLSFLRERGEAISVCVCSIYNDVLCTNLYVCGASNNVCILSIYSKL